MKNYKFKYKTNAKRLQNAFKKLTLHSNSKIIHQGSETTVFQLQLNFERFVLFHNTLWCI